MFGTPSPQVTQFLEHSNLPPPPSPPLIRRRRVSTYVLYVSSLTLICIFLLYEFISCSLSAFVEDVELISAYRGIFYVPDFLRLFMTFF